MLTEQAERTELLHQQKQVIMAAAEQNLNNLEKCHKRYELLLERLDIGRESSIELHNFLLLRCKFHETQQAEAKSTVTAFGSREVGTLRQAAVSQDHFLINSFEQLSEMNNRVFSPVLERLNNFVKDTRSKYSLLQNEGARIYKNLRDKKSTVDKAWTFYENLMTKSVILASRGKSLETDPFLAARQYQLASASYKNCEIEYSSAMSKLFGEIITFDGRRIDEMKSILLDWFLAEKTLSVNRVKLIDTSLAYIKAIDREKDVNDFVNKGEFIVKDCQTIFDVLPKGIGSNIASNLFYKDILMHGTFYRQGRFISSN